MWMVVYIVWCMQYLQMKFCDVPQQNQCSHLWVSVAAVELALTVAGKHSGVAAVEAAFAGATAVQVVLLVAAVAVAASKAVPAVAASVVGLAVVDLLNMEMQLGLRLKWQGNHGKCDINRNWLEGCRELSGRSTAWLGITWQMN